MNPHIALRSADTPKLIRCRIYLEICSTSWQFSPVRNSIISFWLVIKAALSTIRESQRMKMRQSVLFRYQAPVPLLQESSRTKKYGKEDRNQYTEEEEERSLRSLRRSWQGGIKRGSKIYAPYPENDARGQQVLWMAERMLLSEEIVAYLQGPRAIGADVTAGTYLNPTTFLFLISRPLFSYSSQKTGRLFSY
jgi:hypothetical protein